MSRTPSPSSRKPYGVARVVAVWKLARSSFYAIKDRQARLTVARKHGPKGLSDADLLEEILSIIGETLFHGEGHRKLWARLRHKGIRVWKERALRLMREHQLLSPCRQPDSRKTEPHEGSIVADATATVTADAGQITILAAIDHCNAECIGIHAVKGTSLRSARTDTVKRFATSSAASA